MKRRALAVGLCAVWWQPLCAGAAGAEPSAQAPTAKAPADLARSVGERLRRPDWLRGDFTQAKTVQGFSSPLVSHGDFVLARERGLLWRTSAPFASELRLTRREIVATQGGKVSARLEAAREPAVRVISTLMFALLDGDVGSLSELFEYSGGVQGPSWQLALTPKPGPLRQVLQKVDVKGDTFVRRIHLAETSGDDSVIQLSNLRPDDAPDPGLFP